MGLFDTGIPSGIQMMLVNMVKQAAPQVAEQLDKLTNLAVDCKAQLDRIETRLDQMEKSNAGSAERKIAVRHVNGAGGNQIAIDGAGKQTGDDDKPS
jgi:phage shock protein A